MRNFGVSIKELEFGNRLIPTFYYYTKIIKVENVKKGIKYIPLSSFADVSDGEHSHIPRNNKGGIRYLYGRNIREGIVDFDLISDDSYIAEKSYKTFRRCHINQNDILIAIYGTIGKSAIYKEEYIGLAGIPRHISNIKLHNDSPLTGEFIISYFRSKIGKWLMNSVTTGNIQQLLSLKNIKKFELPIIEKEYIDKITSLESQATECIIESQEKLKEARRIFYDGIKFNFNRIEKEMCFSLLFTQLMSNIWTVDYYNKLYVNTALKLKESNGTIRLGDIATFINGDEVGSDNYLEYIYRKEDSIPFIRTSDIVNYEADLFPDYYIPKEISIEFKQDIQANDVLFVKDGKVGVTGLLTTEDNVIISSGIVRARTNTNAKKLGITPEYLFIALSTPEVGYYAAKRRTVVASTIPHLRQERLEDMEIPFEDEINIKRITSLVKEAFELKSKRKRLLKESTSFMEKYFELKH